MRPFLRAWEVGRPCWRDGSGREALPEGRLGREALPDVRQGLSGYPNATRGVRRPSWRAGRGW